MTAIQIMYPLKSFAIIDQGRARHYGGKIPTVDKRTLRYLPLSLTCSWFLSSYLLTYMRVFDLVYSTPASSEGFSYHCNSRTSY